MTTNSIKEANSKQCLTISDRTYTKPITYAQINHSKNIIFDNCVFKKTLELGNALFKKQISFINCIFLDDVVLYKSHFLSDIRFSKCHFLENTDSIFGNVVDCRNANFDSKFEIDNETKFKVKVYFDNTKFSGSLIINNTEFFRKLSFLNTKISAEAQIRNTHFYNSVGFDELSGEENTKIALHNIKCFGNFYLRYANIDSNFSISNAYFFGSCNFQGTDFRGSFASDVSQFIVVPNFIDTSFREVPTVKSSKVPPFTTEQARDLDVVNKYTALKKLALAANDHSLELRYFADEFNSKRYFQPNNNVILRFFDWVYGEISNCGRSILRPFTLLMVLIMLSTVFYFYSSLNTPSHSLLASASKQEKSAEKPYSSCGNSKLATASLLSLKRGLLFIVPGEILLVKDIHNCLYPSSGHQSKNHVSKTNLASVPILVSVWEFIQVTLSLILLFFISMALRNRYRIR